MDLLEYFYEHQSQNYCGSFTSETSYEYFNVLHFPKRRLPITKDRMFMFTPVIYFHNSSVLRDPFNKEIHKYQEAGLITFWARKYRDERIIKSSVKPRKLQIERILPIYKICVFMYVISFIVFTLEVISAKWRRLQCILDYFTY